MRRSTAREIAVQLSFSVAATGDAPEEAVETFLEPEHYASLSEENSELYGERLSQKAKDFIMCSVVGTVEHRVELDALIGRYAKGWRVERLSRCAAAILRQALYEILYMPDVPDASSMDAAVELAKNYESPDVVGFINGVLGGFYRAEVEPAAAAAEREEHA